MIHLSHLVFCEFDALVHIGFLFLVDTLYLNGFLESSDILFILGFFIQSDTLIFFGFFFKILINAVADEVFDDADRDADDGCINQQCEEQRSIGPHSHKILLSQCTKRPPYRKKCVQQPLFWSQRYTPDPFKGGCFVTRDSRLLPTY